LDLVEMQRKVIQKEIGSKCQKLNARAKTVTVMGAVAHDMAMDYISKLQHSGDEESLRKLAHQVASDLEKHAKKIGGEKKLRIDEEKETARILKDMEVQGTRRGGSKRGTPKGEKGKKDEKRRKMSNPEVSHTWSDRM